MGAVTGAVGVVAGGEVGLSTGEFVGLGVVGIVGLGVVGIVGLSTGEFVGLGAVGLVPPSQLPKRKTSWELPKSLLSTSLLPLYVREIAPMP